MTGIRASQKEKDMSRLLYRICGSGYCNIFTDFQKKVAVCGTEKNQSH